MTGRSPDGSPRRILVLGVTCAGKTTLSRQLAETRSLPHVELDGLHWGSNWTKRVEFDEEVANWISRDAWVIDGGYHEVTETAWPRAELVVWLDILLARAITRNLRRSFRRIATNEEVFGGNREHLRTYFSRDSLLLWLLKTYRRKRWLYESLCVQHPNVPVTRLKTPRQIRNWNSAFESGAL